MGLRMARADDAAAVAALMWQAMPEVVAFWTGSADAQTGKDFLRHWIAARENLYSFENTLVFEEGSEVCASITGYDGARLHALRAPIVAAQSAALGRALQLADETGAGEWYVDTVSVAPALQGRGMGKRMIGAFADHVREQGGSRVGLLVAFEKADARRLYERIGFVAVGEKRLADAAYHHMVWELR
ncbi:MAG: GNAT family N-acetyltransferase [Cardiobacteriaceae bacterium]|nr:GNAT family N-acetyltransferase [Cardiobacteriaceae bacterium]